MAEVHPGHSQDDHRNLRQRAYQWCLDHRQPLSITEELRQIQTQDMACGIHALMALADIWQVKIMVVLDTYSGTGKKIIAPFTQSAANIPTLPVYFHLSGHYDALCSSKSGTLPNLQAWHKQHAFLEDIDQRLSQKQRQGPSQEDTRPPKRRRKTPATFAALPRKERDWCLLTWLVGEESAQQAVDGNILSESVVRQNPCLLPTQLLDEQVHVEEVRAHFTREAWALILETMDSLNKEAVWICKGCNVDIRNGEMSVACDQCLEWFHLPCAALKKKPRSKNWFCPACKW